MVLGTIPQGNSCERLAIKVGRKEIGMATTNSPIDLINTDHSLLSMSRATYGPRIELSNDIVGVLCELSDIAKRGISAMK